MAFHLQCLNVHAPIRAIASAQATENVQRELQGAMISAVSLSLIFGSLFYMLLFERFTHESVLFYFSGASFVGGFCVFVVTTVIFSFTSTLNF